jgi:MFS family permease
VVFAANGVYVGTLAARVPAIKSRLDLSDGELGLGLLAIAAGALCCFTVAGSLVARLGSRPATRAGLVLNAAALALVGLAPSLGALVGAGLALGAANALVDVGMNAHGVEVERRLPRPVLSSLHAAWSIGALAGAGSGGLVAGAGGDVRVHLVVVPALVCGAALLASRALLAGAVDATPPVRTLRHPPRRIVLLGLIAFCSMFAEGAAADWSAVYLDQELGSAEGLAAAAFAAFSLSMALGRLVADRLTVRWGAPGLLRRCGVLASAGVGAALAVGEPAAAIAGFAVLGAGVAPIVPAVFRAGGSSPGVPAGQGIAMVSRLGYVGFLAGPPVIGFAAEGLGLPVALAVVPVLTLTVSALSRAAGPAPPGR